MPTLTDKGYEGTGIGVHSPVKGRDLDIVNQSYNMLLTAFAGYRRTSQCRTQRALAVSAANPPVPDQNRHNCRSRDRAIDLAARNSLRKPQWAIETPSGSTTLTELSAS